MGSVSVDLNANLSSIANSHIAVEIGSLLLHCCILTTHYWAVTRWLEFELTLEEKVLGIQPFLGKVRNFLMDLFLFLLRFGFFVLRFVLVQSLQHLGELLDLRFVNSFQINLCFRFLLFLSLAGNLCTGFRQLLYCLIL